MSIRILVVDDETDLQEILQFNLRYEGYDVDTVSSAEEALDKDLTKYDLFLLDVMMGTISGFKFVDILRSEFKINTPVIFLTAKDKENDMLTGFSLGADDYIKKPFSIVELKARIKAVVSRSLKIEKDEYQTVIGSLLIDTDRKEVKVKNKVVELTKKEYQILETLINNSGRYVTRDQILDKIWSDTLVSERTVDVHITRLRKRLGSFGKNIKSRTGYGYYLDVKDY